MRVGGGGGDKRERERAYVLMCKYHSVRERGRERETVCVYARGHVCMYVRERVCVF